MINMDFESSPTANSEEESQDEKLLRHLKKAKKRLQDQLENTEQEEAEKRQRLQNQIDIVDNKIQDVRAETQSEPVSRTAEIKNDDGYEKKLKETEHVLDPNNTNQKS